MGNVDTIKQIYEAFGKGDIPTIMNKLDENLAWDTQTQVPGVPWLSPRRGEANMPTCFASLMPLHFTRFEPHTFFADADKVFVLIHIEVESMGEHYAIPNENHLWKFGGAKQDRGISARHRHRPAPAHVQGRMTAAMRSSIQSGRPAAASLRSAAEEPAMLRKRGTEDEDRFAMGIGHPTPPS